MLLVRLDGARRRPPIADNSSIALGGYLGTAFPSNRPLAHRPSRRTQTPWWRRRGLHAVATPGF